MVLTILKGHFGDRPTIFLHSLLQKLKANLVYCWLYIIYVLSPVFKRFWTVECVATFGVKLQSCCCNASFYCSVKL